MAIERELVDPKKLIISGRNMQLLIVLAISEA